MTQRNYYLAIDIGASSGRHILGWMENGTIRLEEIYRFANGLIEKNCHLCWDIDRLFSEIINGLKKCRELNRIPASIGIDTWGVDFVLLDKNGKMLGDSVSYRDKRTENMDEQVYKIISEKDLYSRNGIQKLIFNTIYQLYAIKQTEPEMLNNAKHFLMIPEYLNFLLTGQIKNEYTNSTTTQLVNANTQDWDYELMEMLGIPTEIFGKIYMPKTVVDKLTDEIAKTVGFNTEVILPPTHDTASAVLAVPTNDYNAIYLSSGTWSLMGIERMIPDCTELSRQHNFTNEGGYHYRYRYLKNIMGMWMMQCVRKEFRHKYSFHELFTLADIAKYFPSVIDVNDESFLAPESMIVAVQDYCKKTDQEIPQTEGEILYCIYNSLAKYYAKVVKEIEEVTRREYKRIHIIGGGCQDVFLNRLTAKYTGKDIYVGPIEATAVGNIVCQMRKANEFPDLIEARKCIAKSFDVHKTEIIEGRFWEYAND